MLEIALTIFILILIPVYTKTYGIKNFLWFSDIGLFQTVLALWLKSSLLISMASVGILVLELIWCVDFFFRLVTKRSLMGHADYMFDKNLSFFVRCLSLFHIALPVIWIIFLADWGYDDRAFYFQTCVVWGVLVLTYFFTDVEENINWVFVPALHHWKRLPSSVWLVTIMIGYPAFVMFPIHLLLEKIF